MPAPLARLIGRVDDAQRRSARLGLVFGVIKKYGDDRGSTLAALLTYYGFMSLFPLLLVFTTVVGFVGGRRVEGTLVGSALRQLPAYGPVLSANAPHPLTGTWLGLGLGLLGLVYGSLGVTQTAQFAMAQVWNVPAVVRPGFVARLLRGLLFFVAIGGGIVLTAGVAAVAAATRRAPATRVAVLAGDLVLNVALYEVAFRLLTPPGVADARRVRAGAVVAGTGYTVLVTAGTALAKHQLSHARAVYGQFGLVLGLIGWLYLVSQLTLYAAELNVVRNRHLWPRSIVDPITDVDRRVLRDIAHQEERRPEERVGVGFEPGAVSQVAIDARQAPPERWEPGVSS